MKIARVIHVIAIVLLMLAQDGFAQQGTKRALLIGINKYQALPALSGSRNDVETIREILVRRYGFNEENITILLDEAATRAGILQALETFVASVGPDDTALFHYSGHGSQVEDLDGDEPDGLDETICPQDARTEGVPDITDDELGRILGRLKAASSVVVLDSCHSGTALRSTASGVVPRSVAPDTRLELYDSDAIVSRGVVPAPGSEPYVLFSAAASHQQELDGPFGPQGERLGLLTAALSRTLEARSGNLSPRELLAGVEQNVEKIKPIFAGYPVPEAQLEGQLAQIDRPLFTPTGESTSQELAITSVRPGQDGVRIFVDPDKRRLLRRAIAPDVADRVEWVDAAADADVVVDCRGTSDCEIFGPGGAVRVATLNLPDDNIVAQRVATFAAGAGSIAELLSIDNTGNSFQLSLGATGRPATATVPVGTRGIQLTASVGNHHIRFYNPPEERSSLNSLQLTVQTDTPCYLTIVTVDSAGTIQQLLPNPLSEQNRFVPEGFLQANQNYLIPDSFDDDNRAGFHLDYAPPAGTDTVRAFCTVDRRLAQALRQDVADIAAGRYGVSVAQTLVSARGLTELRPDGATAPGGAWATATITIDIAAN